MFIEQRFLAPDRAAVHAVDLQQVQVDEFDSAKKSESSTLHRPISATARRQNFKHIPRRHLGLADVA